MPEEGMVEEDSGAKRERSPSFPYIGLPAAIDLTRKLYREARVSEVRISDAAQSWGLSPKSGSLHRYVAALGQFGLLETSSTADGRKVKVSQDGRRILEDEHPGTRESLMSKAALLPRIVRGLYLGEDDMPHWGDDRPSDSIAENALRFDLNFGQEAARRFLPVYDATIPFVVDRGGARPGIDRRANAETEAERGDIAMWPRPQKPAQQGPAPREFKGALNDIEYQNAGKGRIRISAVLDLEGLNMLEKKIAAFRMLIS